MTTIDLDQSFRCDVIIQLVAHARAPIIEINYVIYMDCVCIFDTLVLEEFPVAEIGFKVYSWSLFA